MSTLEWTFVAIVVGVLFVGGSMVAVWWWKLVARAAPYQDELERTRAKHPRRDAGGVVVVRPPSDPHTPDAPHVPSTRSPNNGDVKA